MMSARAAGVSAISTDAAATAEKTTPAGPSRSRNRGTRIELGKVSRAPIACINPLPLGGRAEGEGLRAELTFQTGGHGTDQADVGSGNRQRGSSTPRTRRFKTWISSGDR